MSLTNSNEKNLLPLSFQDLKDDFEELVFLVQSNLIRLKKFKKELKKAKKHIREESFDLIISKARSLQDTFKEYLKNLLQLQKQASNNKQCSLTLLRKLEENKNKYFDLIRTQQALIGVLITSTDWQSPSFTHSLFSMAGRQTGKIKGTINDYKRDVHLDEENFEKLYLKEYIDHPLKFSLHAYLTNSGMAAFSTILSFLLSEKKIKGEVLVGKSVYFQYKQILTKSFSNQIIEVDEEQTDEIIKVIKEEKPRVIFFDSLCNAKNIPVPDLRKILPFIYQNATEQTYMILDNACLCVAFQAFKLAKTSKKVRLIVFESLNKYFQFGLDRVTAGIIIAQGKDAGKIYEYRKHSGTNITDSSVYALPKPNRKMLEKRLKRHQRNASMLALHLQDYIDHQKNSGVEKIIYPGLPNHPCYQWTKDLPFQGSFFNIQFSQKMNTRKYKLFLNMAINEAKKRKVNLAAGTSFGLNTTRIYLTSLWTDYGEPFIRISVGTENLLGVEKLKEVFKAVIDRFSRFPL